MDPGLSPCLCPSVVGLVVNPRPGGSLSLAVTILKESQKGYRMKDLSWIVVTLYSQSIDAHRMPPSTSRAVLSFLGVQPRL